MFVFVCWEVGKKWKKKEEKEKLLGCRVDIVILSHARVKKEIKKKERRKSTGLIVLRFDE